MKRISPMLDRVELTTKMTGEYEQANAFIEIHPGAGGTESQDWAEMLLRMYLRWAERRGWKTDLVEVSSGEVAGIKSARVISLYRCSKRDFTHVRTSGLNTNITMKNTPETRRASHAPRDVFTEI